jgi:hypothetical protein
MIFDQLDKLTSRARLLQRGITAFYLAVGIFVATSVLTGVVAIVGDQYGWIPVALGLVGACFLFYGSFLLVLEARVALATTYKEMDFLWEVGQHFAPPELVNQHQSRRKKEGSRR